MKRYALIALLGATLLTGCGASKSSLPESFSLSTLSDSTVFVKTSNVTFSTDVEQKLADLAMSKLTVKVDADLVSYTGISNSLKDVLTDEEINSFLTGETTEEALVDTFTTKITTSTFSTDATIQNGKISDADFAGEYVTNFVTQQMDYLNSLKDVSNSDVYKSVQNAQSLEVNEFVCIPYKDEDTTIMLHVTEIKDDKITGEIINLGSTKLTVSNVFCEISGTLEVSYFNEKEEIEIEPGKSKEFTFTVNGTDKIYWYDDYLNNLYKITNVQEEIYEE